MNFKRLLIGGLTAAALVAAGLVATTSVNSQENPGFWECFGLMVTNGPAHAEQCGSGEGGGLTESGDGKSLTGPVSDTAPPAPRGPYPI